MAFYELLAEWSESLWPWLVNHLWQATLFCLFVLAVASLLKRAPARLRYSLWLLALIKFVVPAAAVASLLQLVGINFNSLFASENAVANFGMSPLLAPVPIAPPAIYAVEQLTPVGPNPFHTVAPLHNHGYLYVALTLVWVTVCALLIIGWLKNRKALTATIKAGEVIRFGREARMLERVRSWLSLRRQVSLVVSPLIAEPGVWGVFRPVVVLPEGIADCLTDDELEAVMLHELAHIERWDNLMAVLQRIVCCLFWFHPLLWLLDRQLLAEREQCCDDTVIKLGGASKVYASSIAKVCRHSLGRAQQPGLANAAGPNLKRRIGRILASDISRSFSVSHFALLSLGAAALLFLSAVAGGRIKSAEGIARNFSDSGVDPRFLTLDAEPPQAQPSPIKAAPAATLSTPTQPSSAAKQIASVPGQPVRITAGTEQIAPPDVLAVAEINQRNVENARQMSLPQAEPPRLSAAVVPASVVQNDLSRFVGRYEVDPAKVENFVLDITLEGDALWLKPSHAHKRQLLPVDDTRLVDAKSDFRFTAISDGNGRVKGLRLDSWGSDITARKLRLPQPSLQGNTTFRLSGHPDARIVAVAGSFNNWNQSQFLFSRVGGEWVCKINLPPGKYEYKFIIDGNWLVDPRNPKTMYDDRGNENSVLVSE